MRISNRCFIRLAYIVSDCTHRICAVLILITLIPAVAAGGQNTVHFRNCTEKIIELSSYNSWDSRRIMVYQGGSGTAILSQRNGITSQNSGLGETGSVQCDDWNMRTYPGCQVEIKCASTTPCPIVMQNFDAGDWVYYSSDDIQQGDVCGDDSHSQTFELEKTCERHIHIRNAVPGQDIKIARVAFGFRAITSPDWVDIDSPQVTLHQSQRYSTNLAKTTTACDDRQWKVQVRWKCLYPGAYEPMYESIYFSGTLNSTLYIDAKDCQAKLGTDWVEYWLDTLPDRTVEVSGNVLTCSPEPQVTLYPRPDKTGGPVIFKNIAMSSLNDAADDNGSSLNDWTGSLEVISGTWRFFKHDNYEGKQMYVAAPHTIKRMASGYSTWAANGSGLANSLSSMKPVSCDSKPLGSRQNKGYMGYLYGYQDNACLQKQRTGFDNGIDIHYWDQCNGHTQQNRAWYWDSATGYIHNLEKPEYCIHKTSGGFNPGDNIHLWRCDDGLPENKEWDYNINTHQIRARHDGGGHSGFCIDHSGTHNGAKIHLWSCSPNDGNTNNQWKITWGPNGN